MRRSVGIGSLFMACLISVPLLGRSADGEGSATIQFSRCQDGVLSVTMNQNDQLQRDELIRALKVLSNYSKLRSSFTPAPENVISFDVFSGCRDEGCAQDAGWYDVQADLRAISGVAIGCANRVDDDRDRDVPADDDYCSEDEDSCSKDDAGHDDSKQDDGKQDDGGDENPGGVIIGN